MNYKVNLISKEENTPTTWYGGTSAELTTYPANSCFAKRDFLWRLGIAKIDIEQSNFSSLPEVSRHLMVTEGNMQLEHVGRYSKTLSQLDSDTFLGDFETKTYGTCSVFNLMTRENYKGTLKSIVLAPESTHKFSHSKLDSEELIAICFYPIVGSFKTSINNTEYIVNSKDLLRIDCIENKSCIDFSLLCNSSKVCTIIVSIVYK